MGISKVVVTPVILSSPAKTRDGIGDALRLGGPAGAGGEQHEQSDEQDALHGFTASTRRRT